MITIDIKAQLTDAVLAEALPHLGQCTYIAPCIIGAMVTPAQRVMLQSGFSSSRIASIAYESPKYVNVIEPYYGAATELQGAFDSGNLERFNAAVAKIRAYQ